MAWIKKDSLETLDEVITRNLGFPADEIDDYKITPVQNLDLVAKEILAIRDNKSSVTVFADYDADGICSAVILNVVLHSQGIQADFRFPKRTTGYGLQTHDVDTIDSDYIITVDNGIAAIDAIKAAKDKGIKVIVIDHHLRQDVLPDADIIVDPHVFKEDPAYFEDWCGAGLSFELSRLLCDKAEKAICLQFAAIATIADVVPLKKDNRWIVKTGLKLLNNTTVLSLKELLSALELSFVDEQSIGFKIGPVINAMGRVKDDAESVFNYFMSPDNETLQTLVETNELRKQLVTEALDRAYNIISADCLMGDIPIIVYDPQTIEGIVGVVAGRLTEDLRVPVICLTDSADPDVIKGSARSVMSVNIKEALDAQASLLLHYGGHTGAAGLSLKKENLDELRAEFAVYFMEYDREEENDDYYYDLEIEASEIPDMITRLKKYAPFGEGNPQPVFLIKNYKLYPRGGSYYKLMGADNETLKLFGDKSTAIGFGMAQKYNETKLCKNLQLLGKLSENHYRGVEPQVEIYDLKADEKKMAKSSLSSLLEDKLKLL